MLQDSIWEVYRISNAKLRKDEFRGKIIPKLGDAQSGKPAPDTGYQIPLI
jgi:hypothetical protein